MSLTATQFCFSLVLLILVQVCFSTARSSYKARIPNGNNVPDPCNPGQLWSAVGHWDKIRGGGRTLNDFGKGFGLQWTKEFCGEDSDGDGQSNGQELGDPNCNWTTTNNAQLSKTVTHPGICEPLNSTTCQAKNQLNANNCPQLAKMLNQGNSNGNNSGNNSSQSRNLPSSSSGSPSNGWSDATYSCVCYCYSGSSSAGNNRGNSRGNGNGRRGGHDDDDDDDEDDDNNDGNGWNRQRGRRDAEDNHGRRGGWGGNGGDGRRGQRGGWQQQAATPAPPALEAPEFNQPNAFLVQRNCICACPKPETY